MLGTQASQTQGSAPERSVGFARVLRSAAGATKPQHDSGLGSQGLFLDLVTAQVQGSGRLLSSRGSGVPGTMLQRKRGCSQQGCCGPAWGAPAVWSQLNRRRGGLALPHLFHAWACTLGLGTRRLCNHVRPAVGRHAPVGCGTPGGVGVNRSGLRHVSWCVDGSGRPVPRALPHAPRPSQEMVSWRI